MRIHALARLGLPLCLAWLTACSAPTEGDGPNPFLDDSVEDGKADTGYIKPDGIEVERRSHGDSWRRSRSLVRLTV